MGDETLEQYAVVIHGRPDLPGNRFHPERKEFGVTRAKKFPPYVFSITPNSCLVHKVAYVELRWYEVIARNMLARLDKPRQHAHTVCGQVKRLSARSSRTCQVPAPDAVLCGRCHGEAATFGAAGAGTQAGLKRQEAAVRLGCMVKGY